MKHACIPQAERTTEECLFHWNLVIKAVPAFVESTGIPTGFGL